MSFEKVYWDYYIRINEMTQIENDKLDKVKER